MRELGESFTDKFESWKRRESPFFFHSFINSSIFILGQGESPSLCETSEPSIESELNGGSSLVQGCRHRLIRLFKGPRLPAWLEET